MVYALVRAVTLGIGSGGGWLERLGTGRRDGLLGWGVGEGGGAGGGDVLASDPVQELGADDAKVTGGSDAEADLVAANGDDCDLDVVRYEQTLTGFAGQD